VGLVFGMVKNLCLWMGTNYLKERIIMNITMNDLEMNTTLDQKAMTVVLGGFSRSYGSWNRTGYSSHVHYGRAVMGGKRRTGRLFQWARKGYQKATKHITINYRRNIRDLSSIWGS